MYQNFFWKTADKITMAALNGLGPIIENIHELIANDFDNEDKESEV